MDRSIWQNIRHYKHHIGETTPLIFKGKDYCLYNVSAINGAQPKGRPDHAVIVDRKTGKEVAHVLDEHYFIYAYVANGTCYCYGTYVGNNGTWQGDNIAMTCSKDLHHWSEPLQVFKYPLGRIFNTAIAFDGKRYVMLFETDDKRYKPFTFRFLESTDLVHWNLLDKPIYGDKKYVGGPALYFLPKDGFFYVTYVNEFINEETRAMNYDTCIARSKDLVTWEEGTRPILFPDYNHRPFPRKHPAVFEINASDAEFIEKDSKVSVFYCGGNQQGVCDNATAEFNGSLLDLFHKFFISK